MITVLPGMGADHRMYRGPWAAPIAFDLLDWPTGIVPDSIAGLAQAVAERIDYRPDAVLGSSLGGMVALELAGLIGIRRVILVGSAISKDEIHPLLHALAPLADGSPLRVIRVLAGLWPSLLARMYTKQHPEAIRGMIRAALRWSYTGDADIFRIHGTRDRIIRCRKADAWIDGGHLIAMSHPDACLAAIQCWRSRAEGAPRQCRRTQARRPDDGSS